MKKKKIIDLPLLRRSSKLYKQTKQMPYIVKSILFRKLLKNTKSHQEEANTKRTETNLSLIYHLNVYTLCKAFW